MVTRYLFDQCAIFVKSELNSDVARFGFESMTLIREVSSAYRYMSDETPSEMSLKFIMC